MPFIQSGNIRYYTFESLTGPALTQAVFTRQGGVSPDPWSALNLGGTVGDDPARVAENRQRAFRAVERDPDSMFDAWLVHGREVVCADAPRQPGQPHHKADAILTNRPEVTLFMRFADCVPILLYDPRKHVAGLVHAGWLGTVRKVVAAAVEAMTSRYHCDPSGILAAIGPSIGPDHYEIGSDVADHVCTAFGPDAQQLLIPQNGRPGKQGAETVKYHLDLWAANRTVLEQCGVRAIEVAQICTACQMEDWYSHRGEKGKTGRFGAIIGLK